MSFGERLAALRDSKSLTQNELAQLTKISRSRLSLYETNKREPDLQTIKQLASFFNVTIDYLLGNSSISTTQPAPFKIEPTSPQLSPDELALIEKYRQMKDDEKDTMHKVANHISPDEQAAAAGK